MIAPGISHLSRQCTVDRATCSSGFRGNSRFAPRSFAASLRAWLEYKKYVSCCCSPNLLPTVTEVRRSLFVGQCFVKSFCAKKARNPKKKPVATRSRAKANGANRTGAQPPKPQKMNHLNWAAFGPKRKTGIFRRGAKIAKRHVA